MSEVEPPDTLHVAIATAGDLLSVREKTRSFTTHQGFRQVSITMIVTATSELARNILLYAGHGEISVRRIRNGTRRGIEVVAHDDGPGIPDVRKALADGYSTSKSLGIGLPGTRRLMDEFEINSEMGKGTTVTVKKWLDE